MKIYISGPMTGIPEFNGPAFMEAARLLRERGHLVFCPAEEDLKGGLDWHGMTGKESPEERGFDLRAALFADLRWIALEAEAICLLPGWRNSRGALAELALGAALDIPAGSIEDFTSGGELESELASARRYMRLWRAAGDAA